MAAPYVRALSTGLKGLNIVPCRRVLTHSIQTPTLCQTSRLLRVFPGASLCTSGTQPPSSSRTGDSRTGPEEEPERPEYIPKRQAKNPMKIIGYAWMIGLPAGIITFLLVKREVDKNRLRQLKVRQRMSRSNDGEYEGSRYMDHRGNVNLDK